MPKARDFQEKSSEEGQSGNNKLAFTEWTIELARGTWANMQSKGTIRTDRHGFDSRKERRHSCIETLSLIIEETISFQLNFENKDGNIFLPHPLDKKTVVQKKEHFRFQQFYNIRFKGTPKLSVSNKTAMSCQTIFFPRKIGLPFFPKYIEYYRQHTILFSEIKTNNLFTGGLDQIENSK